jgi:hypothetical protein
MPRAHKKRQGPMFRVGAMALALVGVVGAGMYVARVQRSRVAALVREAAAQGITLKLGQIRRSLFRLTVVDSRFTLKTSPSLKGSVGQLTVGLSSGPVSLEKVSLRLRGEPLDLFEEWTRWSDQHRARAPNTKGILWEDADVSLTPPWGPRVTLAGATVDRTPEGHSFAATELRVGDRAWDAVRGTIEARQKGMEIGFGDTVLRGAPVRLLHFRKPPVSRLTLTVRPELLGTLADRSGIPLTVPRARQMRMLANLSLVVSDSEPTVRGTLGLTFDDFAHPKLSMPGRLFGNTAAFFARFETQKPLVPWQMPFVQATLPPFTLRGEGRLDPSDRGVRLRAIVRGRGECAKLATLLEESPLRQRIQENVARAAEELPPLEVVAGFDIRTDRPDEARVSWQIDAGCGLPALARDPPVELGL